MSKPGGSLRWIVTDSFIPVETVSVSLRNHAQVLISNHFQAMTLKQ
jgi:hypothetical protein